MSRFKSFFTLCMSLFLFNMASAQSPYQFTVKKEASILLGSAAMAGASILLKNQKQPLTIAAINTLTTNNIPSFERFITENYSKSAQKTSDQLVYFSTALPFAMIALDKNMHADLVPLGFLTTEVFLVNYGLTNIVKEAIRRKRPFVYNKNVGIDEKIAKDATASFFSGHTSVAASMCFATAELFSAYHPDSKWKPWVWALAATVPAATAYYRVQGGKHFLTDVATGYAVGALTGILIPRLHRKRK
jgi:membrane-associated phospholipid phosphatase